MICIIQVHRSDRVGERETSNKFHIIAVEIQSELSSHLISCLCKVAIGQNLLLDSLLTSTNILKTKIDLKYNLSHKCCIIIWLVVWMKLRPSEHRFSSITLMIGHSDGERKNGNKEVSGVTVSCEKSCKCGKRNDSCNVFIAE